MADQVDYSQGLDHPLTDTDCNHALSDEDRQQSCTDNHSSSCEEEIFTMDIQLDTLPKELLLHICSFLDAKFVIRTLSCVCRLFHDMLSDNTFWKIRIGKRWPKKYPAIPVNDDVFDWKEACIEREERHRLWSNHKDNMDYFRFSEGLFAAVDTVHLMKSGGLLAVGSRDRYLTVLDLSKLESGNPESVNDSRIFTKMDAHKGWIWSLSSLDSILASGSWDRYIKFWDMAANGQEIQKVMCKSAVLCTHYEPDFFVAGSYDKRVYHIDPRSATVLAEKRYHRKPVLSLAVDDRYILTGSEDKTICVFDKRANKVYRTLELEEYPMCMSYGSDQLWVGDKMGQIHLVDATDGDFNLVESYDIGHKGKVTGILHQLGAIYTCSTDRTIKVLEPNINPGVITTLAAQKAEVARIDYFNEILVSANSDVSVGIWRPSPQS